MLIEILFWTLVIIVFLYAAFAIVLTISGLLPPEK